MAGINDIQACIGDSTEIFVVFDENVEMFAMSTISAILDCNEDLNIPFYSIKTSEEGKTIETVIGITQWLMEEGASRNALLIGIGGGITTDITGFAAAIYKRGIRCGFVPTTLLSQVDASIGGKNGVNLLGYKNMIGTITLPEFVLAVPQALETLPYREFVSGSAELLKTFIIDNQGDCYEKAVKTLSKINAAEDKQQAVFAEGEQLSELIQTAMMIKASIVDKDLYEHGDRKKLNLGHTFGHAIEHEARLAGLDIAHGEAVGIGIIMAAQYAVSLGLTTEDFALKLKDDFASCGIPLDSPFPVSELIGAMTKDKKAEGKFIHFILPVSVGDVRIKQISL